MKLKIQSICFILLCLIMARTEAQIQYDNTLTANEMVEAIVGTGVSYSNAVLNCADVGSGTFSNSSATILQMDGGIILTSGSTSNAAGPNNASGTTHNAGMSGDTDLNAIANGSTNDACILEFDFIPQADNIEFKYVFGSEEYEEYFCSSYNDVFGFFITGPNPNGGNYNNQNVALLPNGTVVSINNVGPNACNGVNNSSYYNNYDNGSDIEYDGYLDKLTATLTLVAGESYHIKLAIADVGDSVLDSGVFIEVGSFASFCIDVSATTGDVNCTQPEIGYINQTISSGIPPYNYVWSNGSTTEDLSNLAEGTYTCTITDQSEDCEQEVREYEIINTEGNFEPPASPTCPNSNTYSCTTADNLAISNFSAIQTDNGLEGNCYVQITATPHSITRNYSCSGGTLSVRYKVTDNQENTYNDLICNHTVEGAAAPNFTSFPPDITIDCNDPSPSTTTLQFTNNLEGNCNISAEIESKISGSPNGCGDSYTESWTATNICGHSKTYKRKIIVEDNNAPTISFTNPLFENLNSGATFKVQCEENNENWAPPVLSIQDVKVTDDCHSFEIEIEQVFSNEGSCISDGYLSEQSYVWTATDECGNTQTASITMQIVDTIAPSFDNLPAQKITVSCDNIPDKFEDYNITASDQCQCENIEITEVLDEEGCIDNNILYRTWTVTDCCMNSRSFTQEITIRDTVPPTFTFTNPLFDNLESGGTFYVECEGEVKNWTIPELSTEDVSVSDNCHEVVDIQYSETITDYGHCPTDGFVLKYRLVWTAIDECDNVDSVYLNLEIIDTTPPELVNIPEDVTVSCDNIPDPINDYTIYATDACKLCTDVEVSDVLEYEGCINGQILYRTWTAEDCCENTTKYTQKITLIDDTPPTFVFTNPLFENLHSGDAFLVQCRGKEEDWSIPELTTADVIATDNCQEIASVTIAQTNYSEGDCSADGYIKEYKYTWTASDVCGNTDSVNIIMRIVDTIPPAFVNTPEDITVSCEEIPDLNDYTIHAIDECLCSTIEVEDDIDYNQCLDEKTMYRTWTSTDCCNNKSTFTQKIVIRDYTAPSLVVSLPNGQKVTENTTVSFDCHKGGIPNEWTALNQNNASSSDDCHGDVNQEFIVNHIGRDNNISANDSYLYTYSSTDLCGNRSEINIKVYSFDTIPPEVYNFPAKVCSDESPINFIALDVCQNNTTINYTERASENCNMMFYRDFEIKDPSGNTTYLTQTVYNTNPNGPEILGLNPVLADMGNQDTLRMHCSEKDPNSSSISGLYHSDVEFIQDCSNSTVVTFNETMIEDFHCDDNITSAIVRADWEATDMCGNTSSYYAIVRVVADQASSLSDVVDEITLNCSNELPEINAQDDCGLLEFNESFDTIPGNCPNSYSLLRTISLTDACQKTSKSQQIINIEDKTGPSFINVPKYVCGNFDLPKDIMAIDGCTGDTISPTLVKEDTITSNICPDRLIIQRTWKANDLCDNSNTFEQFISEPMESTPTIIYSDLVNPLVGKTTSFNQSNVKHMNTIESIDKFSIVAYDPCTNLTLDHSFEHNISYSGNCAQDGYKTKHEYIYTFTDLCGKTTQVEFNILVEDDIFPLVNNSEYKYHLGCHEQPDYSNLEFPLIDQIVDLEDVTITKNIETSYEANMKMIHVIWTLQDACKNTSTYTETYSITEVQTLETEIIEIDTIYCDSHKNIIYSHTENGVPPFTYDWNIEGKECYIQGDSDSDSLVVYMGFNDMDITLEVTDADGCISSSHLHIACTSDYEARSNYAKFIPNEFLVYDLTPNPASENIYFNVDMPATNMMSHIITSIDGKIVKNKMQELKPGRHQIKIDVSELNDGIYLLKVASFDTFKIMKFIVQR